MPETLTDAQRGIVRRMREGWHLLGGPRAAGLEKRGWGGDVLEVIALPLERPDGLWVAGVIQRQCDSPSCILPDEYSLTPLGHTIELTEE